MKEKVYREFEVIDDVCLYKDLFLGKEKYFLSSEKKQVYLKINRELYVFFESLLPLLDGNKNLSMIFTELEKKIDNCEDLKKAIDFLQKYNFFEVQEKNEISKVEIEMYGKKIQTINLTYFQKKYSKLLNVLFITIIILLIISILANIFVVRNYTINIFELAKKYLMSENINWKEIVIIYLFGIVSLTFHEMGHIISANYFGIELHSINYILKYGVFPSFYVRYKNLYSVRSLTKIFIMSAGIAVNILIALISLLFFKLDGHFFFFLLFVLNISNVVSNLSPFGMNDGYYIISTLFGWEGLRWELLIKMRNLIYSSSIKKSWTKMDFGYITYFIISSFSTLLFLFNFIKGVVLMNGNNRVVGIVLVGIVLVNFIYWLVQVLKKIRYI